MRPQMSYLVGDVTQMGSIAADSSVDVVLDKSTLDALLCGDKSFLMAAKMLSEVQRVLKTGGYYIMVSYGEPESRLFHVERAFLSFDITYWKMTNTVTQRKHADTDSEEETTRVNYIYVCKKLPDANEMAALYYSLTLEQLEKEEEEIEAELASQKQVQD